MSWYRAGTVAVTNGSTAVAGTSTAWVAGGIALGDLFTTDNVTFYEIQGLTSDTAITLDRAYTGTTASSASYAIIHNFSPANAAMMTSVVALTASVQSLLNSTTAPALGLANSFAPAAQATPNMTISVGSAMMLVAGQPTVIAAQTTPVIVAPVANPRFDVVVADIFTGAVSVITGVETASPVQPVVPGYKIPIAKLSLFSGQTAIGATNITDIRPIFEDGITSGRVNVRSFGAKPDIIFYATAILTMPVTPAAGDTVTINGTTLTAVSGTPGANQFQVTGSIANTLVPGTVNDVTRLVAAINADITNVAATVGAAAGSIVLQWKDLSAAGNAVGVAASSGYTVTDRFGNTQTTLTGATAQFGALNAVAIQNTINAAALASGGYPFDVYFPAGQYRCEGTIYLPANVRLTGAATGIYGNPGTRLTRMGNYPLLSSTGVSSLVVTSTAGLIAGSQIEDICLDGGDAFGSGAQATGTIAFSGACAPGNTVTHRGVTFTAVASGTTPSATQFVGGVSAAADAAALLVALQASPSYLIQESTYRLSASATITITALIAGTGANGYSLAKSGTAITVSGSTLSGGGARWTADLVDLSACYEWKFNRVWFHSCAGRALKAQELWDSRFHDCRVTFCGSQDGTLPCFSFFSSNTYSPNYETCNNLYFWGCRFESNYGVAVEVTGNNGIDVWFGATKFEHVGKQLDYLVRVSQATSVHFDPCWMYVAPSYWETKSWADTTTTLTPSVGTINLTVAAGDPDIYAASSSSATAQPVGMSVLIYATGAPKTSWMTGRVNAYNSGTGALQVITDQATGTSQTGWTVVPVHPGLLYAHNSQLLKGTIIGGMVSNLAGTTTTYTKCFLHLDACSSSDLDLRLTQGSGTLIGAALLGYHDTTTSGSVKSTAAGGQSTFTIETGQSITATNLSAGIQGDVLHISGNTAAYASDWMTGRVVSYNSGTGALTVNVDANGWGGVSTDVITSWLLVKTPANAALITNAVTGNPKINITGTASPYSNQVSTNFSPSPLTVESLNIARFGSPVLKFQSLDYQDQLILNHNADFTTISGTVSMTGAYQLYVYDFDRGAAYNILEINGARQLLLEAPVFMRNLLNWYDTSDAGTYSTTTQLWSGGTYNQTQIRGSVFGSAYLPVDGSGNLTGSTGDVFLSTALAAGSTSQGAPIVERYVCVAPWYNPGTVVPATWMHPPPLQLSGTRAAAPSSASGYAVGTYYEYTDPISGDYEGQKVVNSGSLVWKKCRPIAA